MSYFDILAARAGAGGGAPTPQPVLIEKSVTQNGTYTALEDEADGYSSVSVEVPNTYSASDEGKVVSNGALVTQTATSTTTNGTIDTTTNNSVTVNVPNTYTAQDEGKVVSSGALVAQGSDTVTQNGTVDTTLISSLTVNVSGVNNSGVAYPVSESVTGSIVVSFIGKYLYVSTALSAVPSTNTTAYFSSSNFNLSDFISSPVSFSIEGARQSDATQYTMNLTLNPSDNSITYKANTSLNSRSWFVGNKFNY